MPLVSISPMREFQNLEHQIQSILDEFAPTDNWSGEYIPRMDVYEDSTHLYADVDLPGLSKEDVKVTIHKGNLTVSGERQPVPITSGLAGKWVDGKTKFHRRECTYGKFTRSFPLPVEVDPNKIEAAFSNGVLRVAMRKVNPRDIEQIIEIR